MHPRLLRPTLLVVFTSIALYLPTVQTPRALASDNPPATQPTASVRIENFAFIPRTLTITAGTTVTWKNADDVPHTATSQGDSPTFDSGPLDTDDKFSFTFKHAGKYPYYCKVHPHMTGVVIVK